MLLENIISQILEEYSNAPSESEFTSEKILKSTINLIFIAVFTYRNSIEP